MTASRSNAYTYTWKLVAPIVYGSGIAPVLLGMIFVISFVESRIGFGDDKPGIGLADLTTFRFNGDVLAVTTLFLFGGLTFGFLVAMLARFEGLRMPSLTDHLRHCALLYLSLCGLAYLLKISFENQASYGMSTGYALGIMLCFGAGYAILVDAVVLLMIRRRFDRQSSRSYT